MEHREQSLEESGDQGQGLEDGLDIRFGTEVREWQTFNPFDPIGHVTGTDLPSVRSGVDKGAENPRSLI
ncbi:MAG: hypothetical protein V2A55_03205 [Candidatus Jorgensenbacteria bacterium]